MKPILFQFLIADKPYIIGTYGVFVLLACVIGFLLVYFLSKKPPFSGSFPTDVLFIIIAFGLGGACLAGFILFLPAIISGRINFLTQPALISWGGILGGFVGFLFSSKYWKISCASYADLLAPAYLISIGIGRIGCFFGGCCFGVHTESAIGVMFLDSSSPAGMALQPLVPTQLISAVYLILGGCVFTVIYLLKSPKSGLLFAATALYYSIGRFIIEFWRADYRAFLFGLSDGQLFSICFFIAGLIILYKGEFYGKNGTTKSNI